MNRPAFPRQFQAALLHNRDEKRSCGEQLLARLDKCGFGTGSQAVALRADTRAPRDPNFMHCRSAVASKHMARMCTVGRQATEGWVLRIKNNKISLLSRRQACDGPARRLGPACNGLQCHCSGNLRLRGLAQYVALQSLQALAVFEQQQLLSCINADMAVRAYAPAPRVAKPLR